MRRRGSAPQHVPGALGFALLAIALLGVVFKDALLHGWVLGQSDILFQFEPWHAHAPSRWRVRNPILTDIATVFVPFLTYARDAIAHGRFPLWSAGIYAGHPFFASFQSALLSPFTAVAYVVPMPHAMTTMAACRLVVGGVGMYVFLRSLGLAAAAAAFGGIAYLLNPFSMVWVEHPLAGVAAWMPWLLAAIERSVRRPCARSAGMVAIATAALLLTGHPETAFKVFLLGGAYALARAASVSWRAAAGTLALVALGTAAGTLLSLVQLLPFFEYMRLSRVLADRSPWTTSQFINPSISFVTAFVPDFFGNPAVGRYVLPFSNYCEAQVYPGIATWILAFVALTTRRRRGLVIFFAIAAAVSALAMYGTFVTRILTVIAPPLRIAAVSRFGLITIASLIVMAAIGMDDIWNGHDDRQASVRRGLAATCGAIAIGVIVFFFLQSQRALLTSGRILQGTNDAVILCGVLVCAVFALVWLAPRLPPQAAAAAIAAVLSVDLVAFATGFHPMTEPSHLSPPLPELDVIRSDPDVFRVAGWNDVLQPNTSLVYGVQDYRGYDGMGLARYLDFLDTGFKHTGAYHALVHFATPQLIDLLNVKYLLAPSDVAVPGDRFTRVADGAVRVYRNERAQPRAFLADELVVLRDDDARRALRGGSIDLRRVVLLDNDLPETDRPERAAQPGRAAITTYEDARIVIETDADGRRLLVLTDVFYPGWRVSIDGAPSTIHRADYAFRAVALQPGRHIVTFEYAPDSFRWGLYGTLAGLLAVAALLIA